LLSGECLPKEKWSDTVKILRDREKINGNIIMVGHDGETVNLIYIQLARQPKIFIRFKF